MSLIDFLPLASAIPRESRKSPINIFHCVTVSLRCVAERLHLLDRHRGRDGRGFET